MNVQIDIPFVSFAFVAGWASFANPCGAALLPAYVAQYLSDTENSSRSLLRNIARGLSLGSVVSAGFITVFGAIAGVYLLLEPAISQYSIWIGTGLGVLLIIMGIVSLIKKELVTFHLFHHLAGRIQSANQGGLQSGLKFYYLYGVSYALASMACTLPIFLGVMGVAFSTGAFNGLIQFGAYAMGMAVLMIALSLAMVLSRGWLQRTFPKFIQEMQWIGAIVLIFAGGYLIWYNLISSRIIQF